MQTVWKFRVPIQDEVTLQIPVWSRILDVQHQAGDNKAVRLWALVNPEMGTEPRFFRVYGTGHPIDPELQLDYIATVQMLDGKFVGHVFERVRHG